MTPALLATQELTKIYGEVTALSGCTFDIRAGEVFGLLGPNGSGKTTLIRLLMGYLRPTHGSATIDGLDCYHESVAVHERVTYLPGEVRLFGQMRGKQVLSFLSSLHPRGNFKRCLEIADRLDLDLSRPVALCSTGMRQKIALVATLATETPLVILDEPTANLDPTVRSDVLAMIKEARKTGRTILFSSHVLSETEAVCDRVCILKKGNLVHTQVISELRRQHRIRAQVNGALPSVPPELSGEITVRTDGRGNISILTAGELSRLFGWLATLPISEVRIEPISLQAVYDRYHAPEDLDEL